MLDARILNLQLLSLQSNTNRRLSDLGLGAYDSPSLITNRRMASRAAFIEGNLSPMFTMITTVEKDEVQVYLQYYTIVGSKKPYGRGRRSSGEQSLIMGGG